MGREVRAEQKLLPWQAAVRLQGLAAYVHAHPEISRRMYALQKTHARHRVEAVVALDEALALLRSLGVDAAPWLDEHVGHAGYWPCREMVELIERAQVTGPTA